MIFRPPAGGRGHLSFAKISIMRKYWAIFKITWQDAVEYRAEFLGHMVLGLITFLVMYFIWSAVFRERTYFGSYTFSGMMTYVLMTRFLHFASRNNVGRMIAEEIKEGGISSDLLKPFNYLKWWFSYFLADRGFEFILRLLMLVVFFILFPGIAVFTGFGRLFLFFLFILISLFINFLLNIFIASCAFWVTDVRLFRSAVLMVFDFLAGTLVPLDIMPEILKNIGYALPFQYMMFFPIKLYQGYLNSNQVLFGLGLSLGWIVVLTFSLNLLWKRGLQKYEAIGH